MRHDHSEDWNRRLEDSGETRRDVKFRPEQERVIEAEHENAGPGQEFEIAAIRREQADTADRDREKNDHRDDETNRDKGNGRQIAKPEFDCEPGRAPDQAERDERRDRGKFSALFRHRVSPHQVIALATRIVIVLACAMP